MPTNRTTAKANNAARIGDSFKGVLPEGDMHRVNPGLSEETAAALRAHLLGIESADCSTINQKAAW